MSAFFRRLAAVCAAGLALVARAEPELHARAGLPHLAEFAHRASGELRVAYLGGSITAAANGWRTITTEHLRARFPHLTIVEIPAGLPGTGSNLGACRLDHDVLRHHPDLLFVEFAVNDTGVPAARIERTIEGVVRQTRRANPATDLCFVYTVSAPGLPDLTAGRFPPAAAAMEVVASHYGIPSIHLGLEVARRVSAGELDFKDPAAPDATRTFSLDGVHPTAAGHRIYADAIARSLPQLLEPAAHSSPPLPRPLHADNWETATLLLIESAARSGDWQPVPADDENLRGATKHLLPPTWRTAAPGARLEFAFRGRRFGLLGIASPDAGNFIVTIDDRPPVTATFFDAYVSPTFCRQREWFFPDELDDGPHRVRVELSAAPVDKAAIRSAAGKPLAADTAALFAPQRLTLCGALVVGSPRP